ncbi:hypothetical protein L6164_017493 [Bauhinia variegata]|uniref:Uncharacterized protein n=1 Tax=Bauhinia variegata TaxID=167791 RepID=A0ACB9N999_BAUVA|nr:hypothetical protein L6164_017493 [Bauhinia variegata]
MAKAKMEEKYPGCGIKAKPHIESAMKTLRIIYAIVYDMLNQSGFGWNDETKMIIVDSDDLWNEYIKSHPNAKDYRNAQILLLDKLALVFGKDRATGKGVVALADVVEQLEEENNNDEVEIDLTESPSINQVANRLGVAKDVFDDSRSLMNELKKMDLTKQERFAAADKVLSIPHRLHMFWGSNDTDYLAFVKSLT